MGPIDSVAGAGTGGTKKCHTLARIQRGRIAVALGTKQYYPDFC